MKSNQLKNSIEADSSASIWLKIALDTIEGRDPVDALRDAETLTMYCTLRLDEMRFGLLRGGAFEAVRAEHMTRLAAWAASNETQP